MRILFRQIGHDLVRDRAQIQRLDVELAAAHLGQPQQVVDQRAHALAGGPHPLQVPVSRGIHHVAVVLEQRLREAVDAAQRRAKIVRYGIGERLQLAVDQLQFGRPLGHLLLERPVHLVHGAGHVIERRGQVAEFVARAARRFAANSPRRRWRRRPRRVR